MRTESEIRLLVGPFRVISYELARVLDLLLDSGREWVGVASEVPASIRVANTRTTTLLRRGVNRPGAAAPCQGVQAVPGVSPDTIGSHRVAASGDRRVGSFVGDEGGETKNITNILTAYLCSSGHVRGGE